MTATFDLRRRVAIDTIVLLLRAGVIPYTSRALAAAAHATGLTVVEIEEAYDAVARNGYRPVVAPEPKLVQAVAQVAVKPRAAVTVKEPRSTRGNERKVGRKVERRCCRCRKWLPADTKHFYLKEPKVGRLSSMCHQCRKEYQRERYLTVRKVRNMNAAGLGFLLEAGDDLEGLSCPKCGRPLKPGDTVKGTAVLTHTACEPDAC